MEENGRIDMSRPTVEMKNIVKMFGSFKANDGINLTVHKGEIHAILGENGAGKSTLMNILYGLYHPTSGQIFINGKEVSISGPNKAIELGIGMVHQHFMLVQPFTVAENIILGMEPMLPGGRVNMKAARAKVNEISARYGLQVNADAKIEDISVGMQQRAEILKVLYRGADILILDEPTASLTPQEIEELIEIMHNLAREGKTVILITHKLKEIKAAADYCTIIRQGKYINTVSVADTTEQQLAAMMVGRSVEFKVDKAAIEPGEVALEVHDLHAKDYRNVEVLRGLDLTVRKGEIVGIAGIDGNGQTELMLALTGLLDVCHGSTVELGGVNITGLWPDELRKHDIGVVPEDRYKQGLCLDVPVSANLIAGYHGLKPYCNKGVMNRRAITENRDRLVEEYDVRLSTKDPAVGSLSGGNAQKVIIAREFSRRPKVLLVSQPTRGVDIGAIEFIHNQILKMRDASTAVLIISSELSEVTGLSDRVLVMYHGEIVGSFRSDDVSFNELGLYMSGVKRMSSEELSEE